MTFRSLYERFRTAARANPDRMALEVNGVDLTYAALENAAEWMSARMVEALGGASPTKVGLLTSRCAVSYVAYLAALRLGATAVPLNPAAPALRNLTITEDAGLELTVVDDTSGADASEYRQKTPGQVLDLTGDRWRPMLSPHGGDVPPQAERGPDDVAYLIFTSGTTGKPKGVQVTHDCMDSFLDEIVPRFGFGPGARVSQTFEMSFDGSVIEIFGALASGSTLCVAQHSDVFTPVKFVNEKQLTHWLSVPSLISFAKRLRALAPGSMPTLRSSQFGGEGLTFEQAEAWSAAAPNSKVQNCYGPSEATVIVTGYVVPRDRAAWPEVSNRYIPLGHPFPNVDWVLLDEDLRIADDGELCLRGRQRFPGYLDPGENVGRFVRFEDGRGALYDGSEPLTPQHYYRTGDRCRIEHGELVLLGRIDEQVKIRGNRVELGEIESALRKHPAVVEVVVITVTAADGEVDLHALYTGAEVPAAEFAELLGGLPRYMHPRGFHRRETIPLTTVGKVDRKKLTAEFEAAHE
ncbi:AMP-binding protein [Saccharothrix variisporea]|uniref:Amino acid adenylation domain-containing protein n=1 Tax=Saccharothrix variisporea TaxID=543527 RepID=A0A495XN04_9PSEU|nr:AMP-binding protein [Saccharothrix variisporea]RKT74286.1 amino acid adenylation domain-containing protein [Saccharothrix variisporea]